MKLKNNFEFYSKNDKDFIYRVTVQGDSCLLEWGAGKCTDNTSFSYNSVVKYIENGDWIVVKQTQELVEVIEIGELTHYFAELANGEIIVFRGNKYDDKPLYTTITQQDFNSIKKIIDLT
jgi:hypothetical protein